MRGKDQTEGSSTPTICEQINTLGFAPDSIESALADFSVLSLDVFDTILVRRAAHPTDLFVWMENHFQLSGFHNARVEAEAAARKQFKDRGAEVSIEEIYAAFPDSFGLPADIIQKELETETRFLFVNPAIENLIATARRLNMRVIALSDMYLSSDQVDQLLKGAGVSVDVVYTSCDFRAEDLGKYNAGAFAHVAELEGTDPKQFVHVGDNLISDIEMARAAGVTGIWTQNLHVECARQDSASDLLSRAAKAATDRIIVGQNTRRLAQQAPFDSKVERFGYAVGGPLVLGFLAYIQQCAQEQGVERLLLLERDGCILWEAAQLLPDQPVEMRLVPCSRRLAALPSFAHGDTTWVLRLFKDEAVSEATFFDTLVLPHPEDFGSDGGELAMPTDHLQRHETTLRAHAKAELKALQAELADELELIQEGKKIAWVDVGWALSSASALNRALDIDVPCFCVGSHDGVAEGLRNEGYLFELSEPPQIAKPVIDAPEPVELIFSATQPSTAYLTMTENGPSPMTKPQPMNEQIRNVFIEATTFGVLMFLRDMAELRSGLNMDELRAFNQRTVSKMCKFPPEDLYFALSRIPHDRMTGDQTWMTIGDFWTRDPILSSDMEEIQEMLITAHNSSLKKIGNKTMRIVLKAISATLAPFSQRTSERFARSAEKRKNNRRYT